MAPMNLPTDLLRTFVTVSDLGGYTKAADALNRTQPAISLQMKRLETMLGQKLLRHDGKKLELTEDGKTLTGYARQILRLNDEAAARFHSRDTTGDLRIGLPTDYSLDFLQAAVTAFIREHEDINIEIRCDLSGALLDQIRNDQINLAIVLTNETDQQYLVRVWEEQPIWAGAKEGTSYKRKPLPLVSHPDKCEYRNRAMEALNRAGRDWRIAYSSPGINGIQDAVSADLGVSPLTWNTLRDDMRVLTEVDGLPPLSRIRIGLFYKHPRMSDAGLMLVDHLISRLDAASDTP